MRNFTHRICQPATNEPAYYSADNEMVKYGYPLPNCTTYVHGRWQELGLDENRLCKGDAKRYYNFNDGFARSSTPVLGAIACWNGGQYGHVAIVEEIHSDGTMLISESDYISKIVFRTRNIGQNENVFGYKLQGFIVPTIIFSDVDEPETFTVEVVKAEANVRTEPSSNGNLVPQPDGHDCLIRGDRFTAIGTVEGENIGGNNIWYKSLKGNYVWSEGLNRV